MENIEIGKVLFPEIQLNIRDAHKLRGFFGNLFQEHSELLHNHFEADRFYHRYPLVQYKILNRTPTLIAINEGAKVLNDLFLKVNYLNVNGNEYPVFHKNIQSKKYQIGYSTDLHEYQFQTLWMALNQDNYPKYLETKDKKGLLKKILIGNVLSFFKNTGIKLAPEERLMTRVKVKEKSTNFKNRKMTAFEGSFFINAHLPDNIGLGKAVSRGFGTIVKYD